MAKRKNENIELDLNLGKKIRTNVLPHGEPQFRSIEMPPQKNQLIKIKQQICDLEIGIGFATSIVGTQYKDVYELQKKISNLISTYKRKNTDKNFTTSILNDIEVGCWRTK